MPRKNILRARKNIHNFQKYFSGSSAHPAESAEPAEHAEAAGADPAGVRPAAGAGVRAPLRLRPQPVHRVRPRPRPPAGPPRPGAAQTQAAGRSCRRPPARLPEPGGGGGGRGLAQPVRDGGPDQRAGHQPGHHQGQGDPPAAQRRPEGGHRAITTTVLSPAAQMCLFVVLIFQNISYFKVKSHFHTAWTDLNL